MSKTTRRRRLEGPRCTMETAKPLSGGNERWGFLYVILGTAFFLLLSLTIWRYPLYPFRIDDVAWFAQSNHFGLAARKNSNLLIQLHLYV